MVSWALTEVNVVSVAGKRYGWDSCVCTNEMGGVVWWDVSFIEVVVSWVWAGRC